MKMKKSHDALLLPSEISYTYINKVIFIMDSKPKTLQKANDEYIEGPQFSTKVTMSCLDSSLCAPKIETGKKAYLFSIGGNVSSTFRNDFIKVFSRIHDVNVGLETTVQNQHVYQIDDTGTSVENQVPKRPVYHSTQYDKQHILIMQDDPVVRDAAKYLYGKNPDVSSVYMLENEKPKLIKGDSEPLTAESRLVLVGHGKKGNDGEMHLGGYKAEKVADIIEHMNIEENQIKTISVVACDVGSDETFRNTLLKELHVRSIKTELHLRSSLLQVTHTGWKITAEINPDGFNWKHNDDSKKVVLKLDRNGEVVTQIQPGNRAEAMFTTERNILGDEELWPEKPQRFVPKGFGGEHIVDLEALAWAFFQPQKGDQINHPEFKNNEQYTVYDLQKKWDPNKKKYITGESRGWLNSEEDIRNILNHCYELKSGEDILNVITKYARIGEKDYKYLMLNFWIFKVSPDFLYLYLVGKKLNRNETEHDIQNIIEAQFNKHNYKDIRNGIDDNKASDYYANFIKESLQGTYKKDNAESALNPNQEAWLSTMFLATMISESARNFRSFPITLMALDLAHSQNTNTAESGFGFLLNNHPMTRGGTWIKKDCRGFYGSSIVDNKEERRKLQRLIKKEEEVVNKWFLSYGTNEIIPEMIKKIFSLVYGENKQNTDSTIIKNFKESYTNFKTEIGNQPSTSEIKAISTGLKNPTFKRTMGIVMPVTGIAFGIYNIAEDLKRGGALGIIDLTLDTLIVDLYIVEFVQPELAPIIIPVNLVLGAIRMTINNIDLDIEYKLKNLPSDATVLDKIKAVIIGFGEGVFHTLLDTEIFFYTIPYREIENGHRLIEEMSDYIIYFSKIVQAGRKSIHFTGGTSSWNGGGITFCLSNDSYSEMCMNYFVSDKIMSKKCWRIDTTNTNDIVLGIGESHKLTYTNIQKKILMFIPAGSVTVPSGYEALTYSRYGAYSGNNKENNYFAVLKKKFKKNYDQISVTEDENHVILKYNNNHYVQILEWFTGGAFMKGGEGIDTYIVKPEYGIWLQIDDFANDEKVDTVFSGRIS